MFKVVGEANLTWIELSEVILDIETQINRRPLSYVEDDEELRTLTPESFVHQELIYYLNKTHVKLKKLG